MTNLAMWKKALTPVVPTEHVKLCVINIDKFSIEQVKKMIRPTVGGTILDNMDLECGEGVALYKFIQPSDFMMTPLSGFTNGAAIKMLNKEILRFFLDGWEKAYPGKFKTTIAQIVKDFNNI